MATTSVRLPDNLLDALDRLAEKEHTDRSTLIRRAIEEGLQEIALERAIQAYQRGGRTAWGAAGEEGISLWRLLDELERRDLWFRTDEETLREQLEALQGPAGGSR